MPNSRHISVRGSPSRMRATKRRRSSTTELSFHGINTSRPKAKSVTHVSGTLCHPCLSPHTSTCFRVTKDSCGVWCNFRVSEPVDVRSRLRQHRPIKLVQEYPVAPGHALLRRTYLTIRLADCGACLEAENESSPKS